MFHHPGCQIVAGLIQHVRKAVQSEFGELSIATLSPPRSFKEENSREELPQDLATCDIMMCTKAGYY